MQRHQTLTPSTEKALRGARVLVVEDEYLLADDLVRALRDAGATPAGPVSSVEQAEGLIASERVDAAILDLNLRGAMACEFVERLAATAVPCLIVSGYGEDALPESINRLPRLEKPVSPSSVLEALGTELARAS